MKKDVMIVTGAGQISVAVARRIGFGKKIILGVKSMKNCETIAKIMNDAGYADRYRRTDIWQQRPCRVFFKNGRTV